jgi:hypothetical protein
LSRKFVAFLFRHSITDHDLNDFIEAAPSPARYVNKTAAPKSSLFYGTSISIHKIHYHSASSGKCALQFSFRLARILSSALLHVTVITFKEPTLHSV